MVMVNAAIIISLVFQFLMSAVLLLGAILSDTSNLTGSTVTETEDWEENPNVFPDWQNISMRILMNEALTMFEIRMNETFELI